MAKKAAYFLAPLLLICCFAAGYFSPMLYGSVYISAKSPAHTLSALELSGTDTGGKSAKININTAGVDVLDQLPGISLGVAQKIVAYRLQNHPFSNIQEIQSIKGIGEETYNKIRLLICTE